jgi:hypothetical protein
MANADKETFSIPLIVLEWSEWRAWNDLKVGAKYEGGVTIPQVAGVYEVKYADDDRQLTIGKTFSLRRRIKRQLVRGKSHSSGKKIRANEDVSRIVVRWATTDRRAAAEEELHKKHKAKFGDLPKYTEHT